MTSRRLAGLGGLALAAADRSHSRQASLLDPWRLSRGRAQIGVHSAKTDWTRRILDFQYMDYDDQAAHIA